MNNSQKLKKSYVMDFNRMRENNPNKILTNGLIQPYFSDLEKRLVEHIEKSSYVIGCVAWLTNPKIIEALENNKGAKIIVNKEEFLNPNLEVGQKFYYKCLRGCYNTIPDFFAAKCNCCGKVMTLCPNFIKIFGHIDNNIDKNGSILTCGIVNNLSKMHHKFLVFFDEHLQPLGLWTGSYNLSKSASYSLENALFILVKEVIDEYIKEFLTIYHFAESYNWKSGVLYAPIKN